MKLVGLAWNVTISLCPTGCRLGDAHEKAFTTLKLLLAEACDSTNHEITDQENIHLGHVGIEGCQRRARESVYWSSITRESNLMSCRNCFLVQTNHLNECLVEPYDFVVVPLCAVLCCCRSQEDDQMKHETEISELSVKVKVGFVSWSKVPVAVLNASSDLG